MKHRPLISLLLMGTAGLLFLVVKPPYDFKEEQLRYQRVKAAFASHHSAVSSLLKANSIQEGDFEVMLLAYKQERELQLWVRNSGQQQHLLLKTYPFCNSSGGLGPKRRQGDLQIPEGLYHIDRFNPASNFHLSLGINYPNRSDHILSAASDKGGDIFIHGDCVTVGCIPITDELISELYVYAVMAKDGGQKKIPIAIFPAKLDESNFRELSSTHASNKALLTFWQNLKECYTHIKTKGEIPSFTIDEKGRYQMQ